jgi:hypothetical protein
LLSLQRLSESSWLRLPIQQLQQQMSTPPSERFLPHSVQFQRLFRLSQRCFRLFQRLIELKGLQLWLQPRLSLRILRRFEQVLRQL